MNTALSKQGIDALTTPYSTNKGRTCKANKSKPVAMESYRPVKQVGGKKRALLQR